MDQESPQNDAALRCSFCHKDQSAVAVLVSTPPDYAPRAYICDECIESCHFILTEGSKLPTHPVRGQPFTRGGFPLK
jgi:hypothetical protein